MSFLSLRHQEQSDQGADGEAEAQGQAGTKAQGPWARQDLGWNSWG